MRPDCEHSTCRCPYRCREDALCWCFLRRTTASSETRATRQIEVSEERRTFESSRLWCLRWTTKSAKSNWLILERRLEWAYRKRHLGRRDRNACLLLGDRTHHFRHFLRSGSRMLSLNLLQHPLVDRSMLATGRTRSGGRWRFAIIMKYLIEVGPMFTNAIFRCFHFLFLLKCFLDCLVHETLETVHVRRLLGRHGGTDHVIHLTSFLNRRRHSRLRRPRILFHSFVQGVSFRPLSFHGSVSLETLFRRAARFAVPTRLWTRFTGIRTLLILRAAGWGGSRRHVDWIRHKSLLNEVVRSHRITWLRNATSWFHSHLLHGPTVLHPPPLDRFNVSLPLSRIQTWIRYGWVDSQCARTACYESTVWGRFGVTDVAQIRRTRSGITGCVPRVWRTRCRSLPQRHRCKIVRNIVTETAGYITRHFLACSLSDRSRCSQRNAPTIVNIAGKITSMLRFHDDWGLVLCVVLQFVFHVVPHAASNRHIIILLILHPVKLRLNQLLLLQTMLLQSIGSDEDPIRIRSVSVKIQIELFWLDVLHSGGRVDTTWLGSYERNASTIRRCHAGAQWIVLTLDFHFVCVDVVARIRECKTRPRDLHGCHFQCLKNDKHNFNNN